MLRENHHWTTHGANLYRAFVGALLQLNILDATTADGLARRRRTAERHGERPGIARPDVSNRRKS